MDYITVKWLHILSSTILFGAGVGSAFHFVLAVWGRNVTDIAATARHVVVQDWLFTATAAVFQPLSGFWLLHLGGIPVATPWVRNSVIGYAVAIACWLPVVWIQMRLRDLALRAAQSGEPLPRAWRRLFAAWVALGVAAFVVFLAIFHWMVAKP
jgi:uncharacterized membrane protein